jgi:hypothetical protein
MNESQSPMSWKAPDRHLDLGDAKAECEHLRELAVAVLSKIPQATVELVVPEPGLMFVRINASQGTSAEAYSLRDAKDSSSRRYGLFVSPGTPREQESYANSVTRALGILQRGLQVDSGASKEKTTKPKIVRTERTGRRKKTGT